jgi:hypothetical protein
MMSSAAVLLKTFRASRKRFRARAKTVRLPVGIAVRLQPGIPFAFTPESFSRSPRNPFRLAPESAGSKMAIAVYSFCALVMPSIVISNNQISNIPDTYLGDYAAVYVQSNCQSNMLEVSSTGNTFTNLGLGGIVLASQIEGDKTCAATTAQGTISNFTSSGDTFLNWSIASVGTFPAINSTGQNLIHASISKLTADGNVALNLAAFATVTESN